MTKGELYELIDEIEEEDEECVRWLKVTDILQKFLIEDIMEQINDVDALNNF
jgi:hypothetical protein